MIGVLAPYYHLYARFLDMIDEEYKQKFAFINSEESIRGVNFTDFICLAGWENNPNYTNRIIDYMQAVTMFTKTYGMSPHIPINPQAWKGVANDKVS